MSVKDFFVTVSTTMPGGPGYYKITAPSEAAARQAAFDFCPDGRWSFMYRELEHVHELDRTLLGEFEVRCGS